MLYNKCIFIHLLGPKEEGEQVVKDDKDREIVANEDVSTISFTETWQKISNTTALSNV